MKTIILLMTAIAACASGCDKIPGTAQNKAAASIRSAMFDPDAAKISFEKETAHAVCGTVNGKNRMGAYVGATPFIYDKALGWAEVYEGQPDSFDIRRLDNTDTQDPEWNKLYTEIADKCGFPQKWATSCDGSLPAEGNGHICEVWLSDGGGPNKIMRELNSPSY